MGEFYFYNLLGESLKIKQKIKYIFEMHEFHTDTEINSYPNLTLNDGVGLHF